MSSLTLLHRIPQGFYPELSGRTISRWQRWVERIGTAPSATARIGQFRKILPRISEYGDRLAALERTDLANEVMRVRQALVTQNWSPEAVADSFALTREIAGRLLGTRHYEVQLLGGWVLLNGMVAEMETGEGKTLTATLPACTVALSGIPVHIITVNDYLARRDAEWMRPIYEAFGLSVGTITHGMPLLERQRAYACDVTYCTNKELVFDYLKDRLIFGRKPGAIQASLLKMQKRQSFSQIALRGLFFGIVDEADSVLVDEARTPLIISGQGDNNYEGQVYRQAVELASQLSADQDFTLDETTKSVTLTESGQDTVARLVEGLDAIWQGPRRREELIRQALSALHVFRRDRDYLVRNGRVQIVDEFTGRVLADRSWERGLHQMVETKEGCEVTSQKETLARISYQRFFQRYHLLAGMTGTASEVAGELWSVYRLRVVRVPTNKQVIRRSLPAKLYAGSTEKWQAVVERIRQVNSLGRPVLVGTRSVEDSEHLSALLTALGCEHRVLNARQDEAEAEIVSKAGEKGQITVATNMAGRGTDILLGEGVREQGGLHVIGTERHYSRRIDRQLFGRCGRQGDPGSYEVILSLEDEIFMALRPRFLLSLLAKSLGANHLFAQLAGRLAVLLAQHRLEGQYYRMRLDLIRFDDALEQNLAFSGRRE